ncbi:hypothetical protein Tco_0349733 [Tanacetum coccineum]
MFSKNESKEKEAKNIDKEIALGKKVKELDNIVCKMGQSAQTMHMLTKPQVFYDNNLKQALAFQNPFYLKKAQQIRPMLYDGSVITMETNVISIADPEETLMLEEESRYKMLLKQSDPMVLEKKVNIKLINYAELNLLSEDFGKHFVLQQELSDEQALWLQTLHPSTDQSASLPVKIKAPRELPKEVIQNGNGPVSITTDTQGQIKVLPPRTAEEILARKRERKVRTTLLMALPEDNLAKFHKMTDAKDMWDAIKSRFGGNDKSKKMQKYILKAIHFKVSSEFINSEGRHKGYDRFQSLLSQLEIHGAGVSTEDANQKFLRSLPSVWSQVALIMRTKLGVDSLSFDDLYNNLRVFENDVKGSIASSSSTQNISALQLDHEDLTSLMQFDLEEMDIEMKSSQREIRPIWNNVQRVNHQNQFVPTAVLTRTGKIPVSTTRASGTNNVSTARHNFNSQAVLTNAARKISTVKPVVNRVRPKTVFHKTHSPFSRPFNNTTALRTNFSYQKVNTAEVNAVSAVGGKGNCC